MNIKPAGSKFKQLIVLALSTIIGTIFWSGVAIGATKGDPLPFGLSGQVLVPDDAGCVQVPFVTNQNAVAIRNYLGDGGTAGTFFCRFGACSSDIHNNGFPVQAGETLTIDLVAVTSGLVSSGAGIYSDAGVLIAAGNVSPKLFCSAPVSGGRKELRYILVK